MSRNFRKELCAVGIVLLFVGTSLVSAQGFQRQTLKALMIDDRQIDTSAEKVKVSCYAFGKTRTSAQDAILSTDDATMILRVLRELKYEMTHQPFSKNTQHLKQEFIALLVEKHLLPVTIPQEQYDSLLNPPWFEKLRENTNRISSDDGPKPAAAGVGAAFICSIGGEGLGILFPFIMLPRPRVIATWAALDGEIMVGKLLLVGGFVAEGVQFGITLGFWGIGLAFAFPYGNLFGFVGYSLFSSAAAAYIERFPPDYAPVILGTTPEDDAQDIPVSIPELSFTIEDPSGDLMSYAVTTNPDIGSGSGNLKIAGTYSIPIHGLQELTTYNWTIKVNDDVQTTEQTFTFTTQAAAPIVSNPAPEDGEHNVSTDLQKLQFTLKDFQGDAMDYTVETSPPIGSGSGVDVHNGTYSIPISGLTNLTSYRWFVNVTDGTQWTRKTFGFQTGFTMHFDPFEEGWQYRKQITIDHATIPEDLTDFPVLVSITDADLRQNAQPDGDDIIFMSDIGYATLLNYELEHYDGGLGSLTLWVKISEISASEDTVFYMYYGNPSAVSLETPEKTWDSAYEAVWHMNDATPSTLTDSTSHDYTGTKSAPNEPQEISSKIGNGQDFDGTNDNIWIDGQSVLGVGEKTISFWMKRDAKDAFQTVMTNALGGTYNDAGVDISVNTPLDLIEMAVGNGVATGHYLFLDDEALPDDSTYYYYVFTQSGSTLSVYLDGTLYGWTSETAGSEAAPSHNLSIGRSHQNPPYFYWFDGRLDEIRMSSMARSVPWIQTEYANQNSPSTFLSVGPEEPHP